MSRLLVQAVEVSAGVQGMLADHNVAAKWASQVGSVSEGWRDAGAGRSGAATRAGRTGRAGAVETRADRSVGAMRAGEMTATKVGHVARRQRWRVERR